MENLWAVSMGRQFFCMSTVMGHQTKTHACLLQKIKILIIKLSKLSNANNAIEASTLFIQQQEVVESQQIQPTGEQLSIDVMVKLGGIMYVNTVPCIFTMFIPARFFYYKSVFSQFRFGGS